jgi:CheY-like chemotaxis protein
VSRILLIEDDDLSRRAIETMLESLGHTVRTASNGAEGERLFEGENFDLVITDMVMPVQGGLDTIAKLRRDHPNLKLIAVSGGSETAGPEDYLDLAAFQGASQTLRKPFGTRELEAAISELVASP